MNVSVVTESSSDREAASLQQQNDIVKMINMEQTEASKETDRSSEEGNPKEMPEGVAFPRHLLKSLRRGSSSGIGNNSSHSNNSGSGNNSDNSGLISIGNGSFGFNFEYDEMNNSDGKMNDSDSDGNNPSSKERMEVGKQEKKSETTGASTNEGQSSGGNMQASTTSSRGGYFKSSVSSLTQPSDSEYKKNGQAHNGDLADAIVAHLHSIAKMNEKDKEGAEAQAENTQLYPDPTTSFSMYPRKCPPQESEEESGGYNSDGDGKFVCLVDHYTLYLRHIVYQQVCSPPLSLSESDRQTQRGRPKKRIKKLDENRREERNQREKERSFRISKQITELRNLLSSGGVNVPKGTKSSVLTEAANYIRMLQQHQFRSEV